MRRLLIGLFFRCRHTTVMAMITISSIMHMVAVVVAAVTIHEVLQLSGGTTCTTLVLLASTV